jgi:hypothetical protein
MATLMIGNLMIDNLNDGSLIIGSLMIGNLIEDILIIGNLFDYWEGIKEHNEEHIEDNMTDGILMSLGMVNILFSL